MHDVEDGQARDRSACRAQMVHEHPVLDVERPSKRRGPRQILPGVEVEPDARDDVERRRLSACSMRPRSVRRSNTMSSSQMST